MQWGKNSIIILTPKETTELLKINLTTDSQVSVCLPYGQDGLDGV